MNADVPIAFQGECLLLKWAETSNGGASLTLQLADGEALTPFRTMTIGKKGGQRLAVVMVLVNEDTEQPMAVETPPKALPPEVTPNEPAKGGQLSRVAAMLSGNPMFQQWANTNYGDAYMLPRDALEADRAAHVIRTVCGVNSRAELDHDEGAAEVFHRDIRRPYIAWVGAQ